MRGRGLHAPIDVLNANRIRSGVRLWRSARCAYSTCLKWQNNDPRRNSDARSPVTSYQGQLCRGIFQYKSLCAVFKSRFAITRFATDSQSASCVRSGKLSQEGLAEKLSRKSAARTGNEGVSERALFVFDKTRTITWSRCSQISHVISPRITRPLAENPDPRFT